MNTTHTLVPRADQLDRTDYRKAISRFPTGIAIVACAEEDGRFHGMTISSFTSISMDPPTVMISLKTGKMHRLVNHQGRFGISVLRQDQQHYSAHFGGKPDALLQPDFVMRERVPTMAESIAWFACEITERIQVQDHTLFIAQVASCGHVDGSPLLFFASRYHSPEIECS